MQNAIRSLIVLVLVVLMAANTLSLSAQPTIGHDAFERVWNEQDGPIADEIESSRSWTWGPEPISTVLNEKMLESPGGMRQVQYFDKSRMEINDPNADPNDRWFVTNGLLPIEMMTGQLQVGFDTFESMAPANVSAIGDPDTYPTYAELAPLYASPGTVASADLGEPVTQLLQPDGSIGVFDVYEDDPSTMLVEGSNGHGVPQGFLDFQETEGIIYRDGRPVREAIYFPKFVFGLPVTAAYWVQSRVAGKELPILFQVFERRVLTYNPTNPAGARIEMGNVGQHFYRWRYDDNPPPTADPTPAPPTYNQPERITPFGMNTYITGLERLENDGMDGIERLLGLGREAGVDWAREELSWANLEPGKKGEWNWQYYDDRVLQLAEAGYGIVGVVMTTPGWARVDDCGSRGGRIADYWCPPANPQDFGDAMRVLVEHYDGDGQDDAPGSPRVAAWQIWNEPSTYATWPGSPAEYGALLAAGYQGAKAADRSAIVATGGVYLYDGMGTDPNDGMPFLNKAIAAVPAAAQSFDVLAIHPYMPTSAPDAPVIFSTITLWGRINTALGWLQEQGAANRPLWISEIGWSTCTSDDAGCTSDVSMSESQQATFLVRSYILALALGVQHVSYFQLEDKFDGDSRIYWGEASILGKRSQDYRQKPAYRAYQVLQQQLADMDYQGTGEHNTFDYDPTIENPEDLYHFRFTGSDGSLLDVLWHNSFSEEVTFALEPGMTAEQIQLDGSTTRLNGSTVELTVGAMPVYIRQSSGR